MRHCLPHRLLYIGTDCKVTTDGCAINIELRGTKVQRPTSEVDSNLLLFVGIFIAAFFPNATCGFPGGERNAEAEDKAISNNESDGRLDVRAATGRVGRGAGSRAPPRTPEGKDVPPVGSGFSVATVGLVSGRRWV